MKGTLRRSDLCSTSSLRCLSRISLCVPYHCTVCPSSQFCKYSCSRRNGSLFTFSTNGKKEDDKEQCKILVFGENFGVRLRESSFPGIYVMLCAVVKRVILFAGSDTEEDNSEEETQSNHKGKESKVSMGIVLWLCRG